MNYCKPIDATTAEKYNLRQLKADYPDVSFPKRILDGSLDEATLNERAAEYGVYPYTVPAQPAFDAAIERIEEGLILNNAGTWTQQWITVPLTQAELDALAAQALEDGVRADTLLKNFMALGPAGIETYIDANSTNMASANEVLKKLAKMIWLSMNRQF
tara:strand:- start:14324 stop:14800 length:477 start_codon:yes stop_codon:yes gene_type:complete